MCARLRCSATVPRREAHPRGVGRRRRDDVPVRRRRGPERADVPDGYEQVLDAGRHVDERRQGADVEQFSHSVEWPHFRFGSGRRQPHLLRRRRSTAVRRERGVRDYHGLMDDGEGRSGGCRHRVRHAPFRQRQPLVHSGRQVSHYCASTSPAYVQRDDRPVDVTCATHPPILPGRLLRGVMSAEQRRRRARARIR